MLLRAFAQEPAMIDTSRPRPARPSGSYTRRRKALGAFTPVPRLTQRHDGWTPERQRGFIEALADTGSVRSAAHAVNMTPEGAYVLRRHPEGTSFRKAWEIALALGVQRLEDVAMDRALNGVEVPVYAYGQIVGTRVVYNDALLMFLLRNRAPDRFAADSLNGADAATQSQLERLKRQWRKEWEAEDKAKRKVESDKILERINTRIDRMHEARLARMSPALRRYHDAYEAARRAEEAGTSLDEMGVDPFAEGFDAGAVLVPPGDE